MSAVPFNEWVFCAAYVLLGVVISVIIRVTTGSKLPLPVYGIFICLWPAFVIFAIGLWLTSIEI